VIVLEHLDHVALNGRHWFHLSAVTLP
jgi:hypothetical protein